MARYAQVEPNSGIVVNIVQWDGNADWKTGGWIPPAGYDMVPLADDASAGAGWTYDGTTYTPPPGGQLPPAEEPETQPV
jgi:hypothetical protein